eukprot:scaffold9015_cov96-Isochrysis_galbana.AAC.7
MSGASRVPGSGAPACCALKALMAVPASESLAPSAAAARAAASRTVIAGKASPASSFSRAAVS